MALGFSGSNGGIGEIKDVVEKNLLEVSYFINNSCNLNCKHCYVGYNKKEDELGVLEWKKVFEELINLGALTFGNVGKEPLLSWEKTKELLRFFKEKRDKNSRLRFGLVTNATLLDSEKIKELSKLMPTYIDISLDGTKEKHDFIRGNGIYEKVLENIKEINEINPELSKRVFISSVLMKHNRESFKKMIQEVSSLGVKHFLISPYVRSEKDSSNDLLLDVSEIIGFYKEVIFGKLFSSEVSEAEIILKNDFDTLKSVMDKCVEEGLIDLENLFVDEYTTIFSKYDFPNKNRVIINFIPKNQTFSKEIRISHDGFVSNCYAQFFEDYPKRKEIVGNVKEKNISEILKPYFD